MRAIIVTDKVIVLKHRQESERLCTIRAEQLADRLQIEAGPTPCESRRKFNDYVKEKYPDTTDKRTLAIMWEFWKAGKE